MKIPADALVPFDRINYYNGRKPMTDTVMRVTNNEGKIQLHLAANVVLEYEYNEAITLADDAMADVHYNIATRLSGHTVGGVSID